MAFVDRNMDLWKPFNHPPNSVPVSCSLSRDQTSVAPFSSLPTTSPDPSPSCIPSSPLTSKKPTHPELVTINTTFDPSAKANMKPLGLKKGDPDHIMNTKITLEQQRLAEKGKVVTSWDELEELVSNLQMPCTSVEA